MTKIRFQWRNVAAIVACLAVCVTFSACENDGDGGKYNVGKLGGTVWSQYPDKQDWWYGKMEGIENIIPQNRSYANSWIFNPDGTFVHTVRWYYVLGPLENAGVMVIHGNYDVISDSQFKTTNVKTNTTTGHYYGTLTGWKNTPGFTCDYRFETDEVGERIEISMRADGQTYPNVDVNTWKPFWKRAY